MAEMIRTVEKLQRRTIDRRIEVKLDLEEDLFIKGDATQIEQVILNLAVNALDAMPQGGRLTFTLRRSSVPAEILSSSRTGEDMDMAVFETRDTGCGISQEDIERIFEPFFTTLTQLLEEIGYTTESPPGGRQALEVYSGSPDGFDAVILDLSVPGMDGLDCYRELKKLDPSVKVILATGVSRDGRVQQLLDMGVNGFLQKPYRLSELQSRLSRILED